MTDLTILRGSHQIGGCCTEIISGGERILIDLGANLPDADAPISGKGYADWTALSLFQMRQDAPQLRGSLFPGSAAAVW